ncbi:MAG: hypothetical protein PHV28_14800, partial [Kiritimatiellae bacterium]|nr:hypothetical protein [Kiritimatiellia bacterium]
MSRDGGAWATESVTRKDFLGRAVTSERAGYGGAMLVTSNAYDAAGRLVFTRNPGGSAVAFAYDELGNGAGTVRIGAGQTLDFDPLDFTLAGVAALDKYVIEETPSWMEESDLGLSAHGVSNAWWDCNATVTHNPGHAAVTSSVTRAQLTGLSPACVRRTVTAGADGVSVIETESLDAASARKTVTRLNAATDGRETSVTVAGRAVSGTNALGAAFAYAYDGYVRQTSVEETAGGRTLRTLTGYHADGTVAFTAEADGAATNATSYSVRQSLESPGGAYFVTAADPLGNVTTNHYAGDGTLYRTGGAAYPAETAQNADGYRSELRTWRDESGQPDVTRWHYDLASGLVTNKVYADGLGPSYSYLPDGRLSLRAWARGVETAYGYADTANGAAQSASHSDGTPGVTNTYDLAGRLVSVEDGTGARSFAYDARGRVTAETNALAVITREYNALGLPSGFAADSDGTVAYAYDGAGRMTNVCFGALSFCHGYLPHTRHLESVSNSCGIGWHRLYEGGRNLIASVTNFSGSATVAAFGYLNDSIGRRVARNNDTFAYNARSELTNVVTGEATYGYGYDGIGNLVFSYAGTATNVYAANGINQYTAITGVAAASPDYDTDGNMTWDGRFAHTWDAENRLVESQPGGAATNGSAMVESGYDYRHRRFLKTVRRLI